MQALRAALEADDRIAYALVFGSAARGSASAESDIDVAIGLAAEVKLTALELGGLIARLEEACARRVDVVLLEDAPPGLAYRAFRDGQVVLVRDRKAFVARKARAIVEYLDFKPLEDLFARGVLARAVRG